MDATNDDRVFSFMLAPGRTSKPRTTGLNIVVATQTSVEGMHMLEDLVRGAGDYVDYFKMGNDMSLRPRRVVEEQIKFLKANGVEPYAPGGVLGKAVKLGKVDACLDELGKLGFTTIESSQVALELPQQIEMMHKAMKVGFKVFAEVGRKFIGSKDGPAEHTRTAQIISEIRTLKKEGAAMVLYEYAEILALMDQNTGLDQLIEVVDTIGTDNIMLEVPNSSVTRWDKMSRYVNTYIQHFGPNVNLVNVGVNHVVAIEKLRHGYSAISRHEYAKSKVSAKGR
jgi:phosphosulfolactate synthase (CoM biosynthesis protein A)